MHRALRMTSLLLSVAVLPMCLATGSRPPANASHSGRHAAVVRCAALGNYPLGPRAAASAQGSGIPPTLPPPSPWRLAGNIILTAYTGCGQPTAGTFSIQGELMGAPAQVEGAQVIVPCASSCLGPSLAAVTAVGSIAQDGGHSGDPLYVRITVQMTVVQGTRHTHAAVAQLSGYLEIKPGLWIRVSFLPPPTVSFIPERTMNSGTLPLPLVMFGWRGM